MDNNGTVPTPKEKIYVQQRHNLPVKPSVATYAQAVRAFKNGRGVVSLFSSCCEHVNEKFDIVDPVALLKKVVEHVRSILPKDCSVNDNLKRLPFMYNYNRNEFVDNLTNCHRYKDIIIKLYSGIFSCDDKKTFEEDAEYQEKFSKTVTDVDLLCVFVAMVSLRSYIQGCESATREMLFVYIFESLKKLKDIYRDQWENWPFTHLAGGNKMRDERTFNTLFGFDYRNGRKNDWSSVSRAFYEYTQNCTYESLKHTIRKTFLEVNDEQNSSVFGITKLYAGKPVYDLFNFLPSKTDELLFGEKLANTLRLCYNYSVSNMPFVLASDTHPVIASDYPPIVPSGCLINDHESLPFSPTDNMTLVSRHAIPSTRKLGIFLLDRELSLPPLDPHKDLGRCIAECMIDSSINDEFAVISCPDSEIKCVERHISCLITRNTVEHCGLCNEKLNFEPYFGYEDREATFDYFPLHAYMDTFEAADKTCSASLCPDCVIRTMLFTYEKVSSAGVAISNAFRCPCCDEYMINWLGRGSEFSKLCRRVLSNSSEETTVMQRELVKRIECCFSSLEMLQNDFMTTSLSREDFLPLKDSKFIISNPSFRPAIPRFKLTKSNTSNRYSLNCIRCVSPLCCDRPDEYLDIETVDVVPPPHAIPSVDVEDVEFDDMPNDEILRYDDGPGTHCWPARLSCGFISSNTPQGEKKVETCAEAIALLGRIPKKKRRGWNIESSEGKAIIALANWYKENQPPKNMQQLLMAVSSAFKTKDCFCVKAEHHPYLPHRRITDGIVSQIKISENPLVDAFFKLQTKNYKNGPKLMEYAGLFVRNLISECLLQMPECIYHRASSFVEIYADPRIIGKVRPDQAARLDYVKSLNISRRNLALENFDYSPISFTTKQDRTVEWIVEQGGKQVKTVTCFNCKAPAIKNGGCVTMTCGVCSKVYCWLCEKEMMNSDHTISEHGLLYCNSAVARKAFEDLYNVEVATLQLHKFGNLECYVLEDGFSFDVTRNRATKKRSPKTTAV